MSDTPAPTPAPVRRRPKKVVKSKPLKALKPNPNHQLAADCKNCGKKHYGNAVCPYAVPYDANDPNGKERELEHTRGTFVNEPAKPAGPTTTA